MVAYAAVAMAVAEVAGDGGPCAKQHSATAVGAENASQIYQREA